MRGIPVGTEAVKVSAEGVNEIEERIILLKEIHVHYDMTIPAGSREKVDRARSTHVDKCPTAQSLKGAVAVRWTADIHEAAP